MICVEQEISRSHEETLVFRPIPKWKRVLDVTCVILVAPLWLPLAVLLTIMIKMLSPGPVFFMQERVGFMGRRFMCFKFRTMKVNADTRVHQSHLQHLMSSGRPMEKLDAKGDPRLIPGGLILRTLGIDELPQIFNVLRGDMSLVGPRPCVPYEYEHFQPRHKHRCETLPGLTGLWQVNGKNRTTFEQMMEFDIFYAQNKSLWLDLSILFRTGPAILSQVFDVQKKRRSAARAVQAKTTSSASPTSLVPRVAGGGPLDQQT
jgi:exopolysaccharide production protein ExoY